MAEQQPTPPRGQETGDQRRIQIRDVSNATHYASFFSITGGPDAIMVSFGNPLGPRNTIQVEQKIVLSPRNAKRMAISLGQVIRRYEQDHGEIDVAQRRPGESSANAGQGA